MLKEYTEFRAIVILPEVLGQLFEVVFEEGRLALNFKNVYFSACPHPVDSNDEVACSTYRNDSQLLVSGEVGLAWCPLLIVACRK